MICTRSNPHCERCPVREGCRALALDAIDRIPAPRPKKTVPEKIVHMLVIQDERGRVLLQRRPPSGIWGGLWSLPEGGTRDEALDGLLPKIGRTGGIRTLPDLDHRLTHLQLSIRPALVSIGGGRLQLPELRDQSDIEWFDRAAWTGLGLPKPVREILESVE